MLRCIAETGEWNLLWNRILIEAAADSVPPISASAMISSDLTISKKRVPGDNYTEGQHIPQKKEIIMKTFGIISLAVLLTLIAGCVRSLHPLYTDQDIIFDSDLVGSWSEKNSKETWEFSKQNEKPDDKQYRLLYTDGKGETGGFIVHLIKIDGNMFLDLYPDDPELKQNDYYKIHLLPAHTFMHVNQITPTLQLRLPQGEWLNKFIKENPEAIQHEILKDQTILTAGTKDLQVFFMKHLNTKDAFGKPSNMTKSKAPSADKKPIKPSAGDDK